MFFKPYVWGRLYTTVDYIIAQSMYHCARELQKVKQVKMKEEIEHAFA